MSSSIVPRKRSRRRRRANPANYNKGRWSEKEKQLFLIGLRKYGKGKWKEIGTILTTRYVVVGV
jgi:hypothetical protein